MKTRYMKKLGLAVLPLVLMASCQNEDIENVNSIGSGEKTTLHCIMGSYNIPQSRAQVELNNMDVNQEAFVWNAGDSFTLYNTENLVVSSVFEIADYREDEGLSASADFVGEGTFENGTKVTAIYPVQENNVVGADNVMTLTLPDVSMNGNADEDWKDYMSQRMFMYADAVMADTNTSLTFNHLCAMIRISYTNATDVEQNISDVVLSGDGNYFGSEIKFGLADNAIAASVVSSSVGLKFNSTVVIASGETANFYVLFFPGVDASVGTLTVQINEEKVEMSLSDMTAKAFEAGKRYWFNVMETKTDGLVWKKDVVSEGVIANLPIIRILESWYGEDYFVKDENGFVPVATNKEAIEGITSLGLRGADIDNLDGIEYFKNLEELNVASLGLRTLDVSAFPKLKRLECFDNNLTELDLSGNPELVYLICHTNNLSVLNVSKNIALEELACATNALGNIDVQNNLNLKILDCYNTSISELNVMNNENLTELYCGKNLFEELNVSANPKLQTLNLSFAKYGRGSSSSDYPQSFISSLDLSNNLELVNLDVDNAKLLTSLDLSKNTKLQYVNCSMTAISSLDFSNNPELLEVTCHNCERLKSINVTKNPKLTKLNCPYSIISELDVTGNPLLTELVCQSDYLASLDVSANPLLTKLDCGYSLIQTLDVSKNTELTELRCHYAHLSELDITANQKLTFITCGCQKNDEGEENVELTLTLTEEQRPMWEKMVVEYDYYNERVNLNYIEIE